ncbi:GIY-YIG nuclease family protein [Ruegeria sp. EL01]|uniref:GIY-YIG nuclease family protein n=1 Tax=Ruegeria sp. EL01 TaxID=2107578 RepID=UPI0013C4CD48|nr:GIY-YIG nuclease family protein [Ruegeria sp. EL01]
MLAAELMHGEKVSKKEIVDMVAWVDQLVRLLEHKDKARPGLRSKPRWEATLADELRRCLQFQKIDLATYRVTRQSRRRRDTDPTLKNELVYVMRAPAMQNLRKIGSTAHHKERLDTCNRGMKRATMPDLLEYEGMWNCRDGYFVEACLHERFKLIGQQYTGTLGTEWFYVSESAVSEMIKPYLRIEKFRPTT